MENWTKSQWQEYIKECVEKALTESPEKKEKREKLRLEIREELLQLLNQENTNE